MATKQQIMASAWNSVLIKPAVDILERHDGKIDIYNISNKTNMQYGQYEYLPLAKRLYKKELLVVIAQLYYAEDVDARIKEALGQAMLAAVFDQSFQLDALDAIDALGAVKSHSLTEPFSHTKIMLFIVVL
ncbi:MAG: hypothetical protein EZS28_045261 [Streblomastix strix]|uniref:Uncharacterized protein n=1 Tax=Streblomastix strix TaxID=222440 RepID=A0A5J4TMU7_9EUKA|nr:MAG: hypothetical protein EZS28_045261 [Streblomastix strix]